MRDSPQVTAPGAVTSMIVAVSTTPNRQNRSTLGTVLAMALTILAVEPSWFWFRCHVRGRWLSRACHWQNPSRGRLRRRMHSSDRRGRGRRCVYDKPNSGSQNNASALGGNSERLSDFIIAPAAYAAGGTSSLSLMRRGRQRGPGPRTPNGAPASAQPIAVASNRRARRYFRISLARACRVASGSPALNSVMTITRGVTSRVVSPIIENMSAIRQLDQFAAKGIAETLHRDSRHYVVPIWWGTNPYDASTVLHAASCFFVEIGGTRFGITAFHVIAEYLADREKHPGGFLMIRNTLIGDWDSRFIDGSSR